MDDYGPASGRPRAADTGVRVRTPKGKTEPRSDLVFAVEIARRWRRDDGTVMVSLDMIRTRNDGERYVWDSIFIEECHAEELASRLRCPKALTE